MPSLRPLLLSLFVLLQSGCAVLPPGDSSSAAVAGVARTASVAFDRPEATHAGRVFADEAKRHPGASAFRLLSVGVDGFLTRVEMADAAEHTLDVQYFILRSDATGQVISDALLRAADRGVRVRILVDDGETMPGDERIQWLDAHPNIEVRVFNPFRYRGHQKLLRAAEFLVDSGRLDYRMHNKLFVADNAVALVGGRNIADGYFQVNPEGQFADDDLFAGGPVVRELSRRFDEYWNHDVSTPVAALAGGKPSARTLDAYREVLAEQRNRPLPDGHDRARLLAAGVPYRPMLSGDLPMVWAPSTVVCDSPDKKAVEEGRRRGELIERPIIDAASRVRGELLLVTPYFVPGDDGMRLLKDLRSRDVAVRVLTNSMESTTVPPAQAGYMRYRTPLLQQGVEIHEVRSRLGSTRGSGQTAEISRFGTYSLHGKMFVFDREKVFIGSMNFDQRSLHLNTEIGVLVDSPVLAAQVAARYDAMVALENAYHVALRTDGPTGQPRLVWSTFENGRYTEYDVEPARTATQRIQIDLLTLLPIDREL